MVRTLSAGLFSNFAANLAGAGVGAYFTYHGVARLGQRAWYFFNADAEDAA